MKSIFSLAILLFIGISVSAQADAIERFFKDYQDDENFTVVYVSPKMFQMVSKVTDGSDNKELSNIVKDLKGLRILTTKVNPDKNYKKANKRMTVKDYEELVRVSENKSNVRFVTKESNGTINELLLLVGGKDEFVMMSFVGNIDLNKISKLAKKLDIDGAEHLDKVNRWAQPVDGDFHARPPLQTLVDRNGEIRTALRLMLDEIVDSGIEEVAIVIRPGQQDPYVTAAGPHASRLVFFEQSSPRGYGDAILRAADFVAGESFRISFQTIFISADRIAPVLAS